MFFFNDTATPEIYTRSRHDALPILVVGRTAHRLPAEDGRPRHDAAARGRERAGRRAKVDEGRAGRVARRSEEHTFELQSRQYLVCRLLLEKKDTGRRPCAGRPRTLS